jgi:hypothetical protein
MDIYLIISSFDSEVLSSFEELGRKREEIAAYVSRMKALSQLPRSILS